MLLFTIFTETSKSAADRAREAELLQQLVDTVRQRSGIIDSMEEDRIRLFLVYLLRKVGQWLNGVHSSVLNNITITIYPSLWGDFCTAVTNILTPFYSGLRAGVFLSKTRQRMYSWDRCQMSQASLLPSPNFIFTDLTFSINLIWIPFKLLA